MEVLVLFLIDYVTEGMREKKQQEDGGQVSARSEPDEQMNFGAYIDTIDDMSEIIIQYGYVLITSLFALINNTFEMKIDAYTLIRQSQRPHPNGYSYNVDNYSYDAQYSDSDRGDFGDITTSDSEGNIDSINEDSDNINASFYYDSITTSGIDNDESDDLKHLDALDDLVDYREDDTVDTQEGSRDSSGTQDKDDSTDHDFYYRVVYELECEQQKLDGGKHNRKHKLKPALDINFNNMSDTSTDMEKFAKEYQKYHEQLISKNHKDSSPNEISQSQYMDSVSQQENTRNTNAGSDENKRTKNKKNNTGNSDNKGNDDENDENELVLRSLRDFESIFHENLQTLGIDKLRIERDLLLYELLHLADNQGYSFDLPRDSVISQTDSDNAIDLMVCDELRAIIFDNEQHNGNNDNHNNHDTIRARITTFRPSLAELQQIVSFSQTRLNGLQHDRYICEIVLNSTEYCLANLLKSNEITINLIKNKCCNLEMLEINDFRRDMTCQQHSLRSFNGIFSNKLHLFLIQVISMAFKKPIAHSKTATRITIKTTIVTMVVMRVQMEMVVSVIWTLM